MRNVALTLCCGIFLASSLRGQEASPSLRAVVDAYLDVWAEAEADLILERILSLHPSHEALIETLHASPLPLDELEPESIDAIPWRDQLLEATVRIPPGLSRVGERAPVLLDISGGHMIGWLRPVDTISVSIARFTPPEFSDEGRDAFLKVLRRTAHRFHGDPDRLWLTGFSWAGHASWDTAFHRPDWLCGIASFGGGPRRTHYRLIDQLRGVELRAHCGQQDDRELLWNLQEIERVAKKSKLSYVVFIDPEKGHTMPLLGYDELSPAILASRRVPPMGEEGLRAGTLLADAPLIESPLIRIDGVDDARVAVPAQIPVSSSLSPDGKRRATIAAMSKAVAKVDWKITRKGATVEVALKPTGVTELTLFLREPWYRPGDRVVVRRGRTKVHDFGLTPDSRVMLEEARRSGERLRLVLGRVRVKP